MEPSNPSIEKSLHLDPHENKQSKTQIKDDEALSLCDLAADAGEPELRPNLNTEDDQDFDFDHSGTKLPENQMCSADEVFFRGQILPLRHSVSSDGAFPSGFTQTRNFTRSEPVSVVTSRSSSRSSTSGSELTGFHKPRIRNQFRSLSHPSPTPQIRTCQSKVSNPKTPSKWSFLQLGPMNPHEIGLSDLKNRSRRSHSSSTNSSMSGIMDQNLHNHNQKQMKKMKTKKTEGLLFGGCRCSADVIESRVCLKETKMEEESRKEGVSSHRTFEWLKQLSIQDSASL